MYIPYIRDTGNLITSFTVILMKKNGGTTLPGGRVSRQSQGGGCNLIYFFDILSRHLKKKYLHTMKLKLKEHV